MKTNKVLLGLALALALIGGAWFMTAQAATDTADAPLSLGAPGALAPCVNFHGEGTAGEVLTVTLPYAPTWVMFHPNTTATVSGASTMLEWRYGMTTGNILHQNGTTQIPFLHTNTSAMTVSGSTVTIPIGRTETAPYYGRACQ